MPASVLDSFALIAYFRDEPGAEAIEQLLVSASKRDSLLPHDRCELRRGEVLDCKKRFLAPQPRRKPQGF